MLFTDKSEVRSLHFIPRQKCFSKARVEWHEIILNGQADEAQPIIDLSQEDPTELVFDLFGKMGLVELFEFHKASKVENRLHESLDWEKLFQLSDKSWNERTYKLFGQLSEVPSSFIDWAFHRKMEMRDLLPLNSLTSFQAFNELSNFFTELNLTRNEGRQILDVLVDLILLGKPTERLSPTDENNWLSQLQKIRNPHTLGSDQKSNKSTWPKYVVEQKFREGDRIKRRLQIQYTDSQDLKNKLSNLSEQVPQA